MSYFCKVFKNRGNLKLGLAEAMVLYRWFSFYDCLDSFGCEVNCMGKTMFAINIINNKVVDNLLILLLSNLYGNRLNALRVIVVRSWSPEMLILWKFLDRSVKFTYFD